MLVDNAASTMDLLTEEISAELGNALASKVPAVTCTIEEVLQPEHIAEYLSKAGQLTTTDKSDEKDVATLRARHHSVARLLASGMPEGVIAEITGYDNAYISVLKSNPSMVELVNHYRSPNNAVVEVIAEKLRTVGHAALNRLSDEIQDMDHNSLIAVAKLGVDRSGNGPMSKVAHEHTHLLDPEKIAALADTARRKSADRIVNVSALRRALPAPREDFDDAG
jgi:hypothetical protein